MFLTFFAWVAGCGPSAPAPAPVDVERVATLPDYTQHGTHALQLDRMVGTFDFSQVRIPDALRDLKETYALQADRVPSDEAGHARLDTYQARLSFQPLFTSATYRPDGLELLLDGEPVAFARGGTPPKDKASWRLRGRNVTVFVPSGTELGSLRVAYPTLKAAIERHDPASSGMDTADFVKTHVTLGLHTRTGLMLPAPSAATWDVKLPETAATFQTWLALEPPPVNAPSSNGATAALLVTANGTTTEAATHRVEKVGKSFAAWNVDLGAWAGQDVTLTIESRPDGDPTFDWMFFGSPTVHGPATGQPRRVVVIGLDTTRPDRFSFNGYPRNTTPEVDAIFAESAVFRNAWTPAPRTRPSFRSATTGRLPLEAVGATNISEVFRAEGFATAGIVANVHLQPRFDFHKGFDTWLYTPEADAEDQVDRALSWLDANVERDTYMFLHLMDPHLPYGAPGEWRDKFVENPDPNLPDKVGRSMVYGWMNRGELDDRRREHLVALHDGEMAYMSRELGRFFERLDAMPGESLVVVHSDHGEEFWEHEQFEHNHTLYDEVTRAVLAFRPKGGLTQGLKPVLPATLMDIGPTLYGLFDVAQPPPTDGVDLTPWLRGDATGQHERAIPIGYLQYGLDRWAVMWNDHKYILHTGSGQEELYDLAGDPDETRDIAASADLEPYRTKLAETHRVTVGPGWRVPVRVRSGKPITLRLPAAAVTANVLDPELMAKRRANIEWGETPLVLPSDVGDVTLSEDNKTLTYTPGNKPTGTLYVLFADPQAAEGTHVSMAGVDNVKPSKGQDAMWRHKGDSVEVKPGTIVLSSPTEAQRMGLAPGSEGSDEEQAMLCALGYISCD